MKILLISPLPPPTGGIATWTTIYVDFCRRQSIELAIVNSALLGRRAKQINDTRNFWDEIIRTKRILRDLKVAFINECPDIVHINSSCSRFGIVRDFIMARQVYRLRIPLVFHCHCNIEDQIRNHIISRFFLKRTFSTSNIILTLNKGSQEFAQSFTQKKCRMIPNFIAESYIRIMPKIISKTINSVLFVGHVKQEKGIRELLDAAAARSHIQFKLAGPVADEIMNWHIPSNVQLLGFKSAEQVRDLLDEADVFLFPSYTEGFSNALAEAMARGVPIIATNVGANADMIENKGGVIIKARNSAEIIDALDTLHNVEYRRVMSCWNIDKVKANYTIPKVFEQLRYIYREAGV